MNKNTFRVDFQSVLCRPLSTLSISLKNLTRTVLALRQDARMMTTPAITSSSAVAERPYALRITDYFVNSLKFTQGHSK